MSTFKKYMSIIQESDSGFTINNFAASEVTDENKEAAIKELTEEFEVGISGKAIQLEYNKIRFAIAKKDNTFYVLDPDFNGEKSKSFEKGFNSAKEALDEAIARIIKNKGSLNFPFTGLSLGDGTYVQASSKPLENKRKKSK